MNFRSLRFGFAIAALLGGAGQAIAQSTEPPAPAAGGAAVAEEITITATATEESAASVPTTVDVVDAAEIAERKVDQAIDLLRTIPGVDVVQSGSRGKAGTIFVRGTNSNHTLV